MLTQDEHPLLYALAFITEFPSPLNAQASPEWLTAGLRLEFGAPVTRNDELRGQVRDVLRHGGYKPTGRGKPASEYLVRAVGEEKLGSINLAVDACNVVSLHSGLPISVVDLDRSTEPFRITLAEKGATYIFNASGQEISIGGLVCLFDAQGPCANAVKDSQRTKTNEQTRRTLSVVWGPKAQREHADRTVTWYRELLEQAGANTTTA